MNTKVNENQNHQHDSPSAPPQGTAAPQSAALSAARQRVFREATRLFAAKGYNGVSVREIVAAAGVTKPTLYYYFPNKEELFKRIVIDFLQDFRRQLEHEVAREGPIRERLLGICRLYFEFARANPDNCRIAYGLYFSSERSVIDYDFDAYYGHNIGLIRNVIADAMARGQLRPGDPWFMALALTGVINLLIMGMLYNPNAIPADNLADETVGLLLRGMAGSGGEGGGVSP